jgi:hypothetical protein
MEPLHTTTSTACQTAGVGARRAILASWLKFMAGQASNGHRHRPTVHGWGVLDAGLADSNNERLT